MGGVIFFLVLEDLDPTLGKGFYFYKQPRARSRRRWCCDLRLLSSSDFRGAAPKTLEEVCYKIEDSPVPPTPFPMVEETGLQTMHHFLQNLITDFVMSSKSVTTGYNFWIGDMEWHESVYCGVGYIDVAGVNLQDLSYKEEQLKNDLLRADPYESLDLAATTGCRSLSTSSWHPPGRDHYCFFVFTTMAFLDMIRRRRSDRLYNLENVRDAGPREWVAAGSSLCCTMDRISLLDALIRMSTSKQLAQKRMEWTPPRIGSFLCPGDQSGHELDPLSQRPEWLRAGTVKAIVVVTHHS
ncbi:hypothetical protein SELMODRAFT_431558 [Selaginella moellendorffii]|uniref:Uncharacterized protein n=1 Tax=Selaginella moellendorffii TaxID=88036 RepID=D8TD19_SELML|nr:hypothetical protein SELMODRAFT_431558 [Selaginella moellendorffii]